MHFSDSGVARVDTRGHSEGITAPHTMKAFALYVALGALLVNIAGNLAANTAQGLEAAQESRSELLCASNPVYCD